MVQGRGMELEELHVGHGHPRPQCHGHTVPGGRRRVGGHREHLAGTAGGQQHVARLHLVRHAVTRQARHADAATVGHQEVHHERLLVDHDRGAANRVDQRAFDLLSCRGPTGVHDAGHRVTALPCQLKVPVDVAVEPRSERDQLLHATGALVDEHPHGFQVAQPGTGRKRVGEVEVDVLGVR